jgi:Kef-type K+ transport system membrane component KefB
VFGVGFGIGLVAGLVEVQRMASPEDLAQLTARYYSFTYVGFVIPVLLAAFHHHASTSTLLLVVAALSLTSTVTVARGLSHHGRSTGL